MTKQHAVRVRTQQAATGKRIDFTFTMLDTISVERWWKTRRYTIADKGRWGPRWLHALIMRAATNCGMVGNDKDFDRKHTVQITHIDGVEALHIADKAIGAWLDRMQTLDNCEIIMGQSFFAQVQHALRRELVFTVPVRWGTVGGETKFHDIPVRIVPLFEGVAIIPVRLTI